MDASYFAQSGAEFSDCETYRYCLWRRWGNGAKVTFVMLNPSTADATSNDPTIERCHRRAVDMGFDALDVVNIFAYRATNPKDLKKSKKPVGPLNDMRLLKSAQDADMTICAWGGHGNHNQRHDEIVSLLRQHAIPLYVLSLTANGLPGHPLYLPYSKQPFLWSTG
ncbi:DUF1643 domain-containing protein [Sneathiella marina]|uniref:DUF1643 domain-containing protein n=1 Tax=Sneathiella marina TaxID=2950108 RepID=A0ABY4W3Q4_9PROT|nr:DUF1643 domain-containing protein [Sneathiella marina]USG61820.1 DUF1643 domain-containing protein [Sneathiella marina]